MTWNPIKWIVAAVKFLTGWADRIAPLIVEMSKVALPIVEMIAAATPTRVDDELIALFKRYGLVWTQEYLALPPEKRGQVLLDAATQMLLKQFPGVDISVIQAAIQLALVQFRAKDEPTANALMGSAVAGARI